MPINIIVRYNNIPRVMGSITDHSKDAVRDNAHFMREYAKATGPVQTGAFVASLYVNGPDNESDYAERASQAERLNPGVGIVPEIQAAQIDAGVSRFRNQFGQFSLQEAIVAPAVVYGIFLEEGTVHMAPRPTLHNAAIATRTQFINAMSKVAD